MKGNIFDISDVDFLFIWKIIRAKQCGNSHDGNETAMMAMKDPFLLWK